jgi:hemoglobin-like flavoprotein
MSLNVALLRHSFDLVVSREPELTALFYEDLFTRHPELRSFFSRNAPAAQQRMLRDALVAVMNHLEDPSWLTDTLSSLGAKHETYGVTHEMYDWVGESLLATLEEVAADKWTPDLARAWSDAYGAISALMQQGTRTQSH